METELAARLSFLTRPNLRCISWVKREDKGGRGGGGGEDEVEVTDAEESRENANPIPSDLQVPPGGLESNFKNKF